MSNLFSGMTAEGICEQIAKILEIEVLQIYADDFLASSLYDDFLASSLYDDFLASSLKPKINKDGQYLLNI